MHSRSLSRVDLIAVVLFLVAGGAVAVGLAPRPNGPSPMTFANFQQIAQATAAYRADHQDYLPIVMSYSRGSTARPGASLEGWCTWSFGGKNNSSYWGFRAFDVEAADRPLNPYIIPDEFFYAPAFPARLPTTHPSRITAQAPMFRDPGDLATHQRNWPSATPGVSAYDDVGTSYQANMAWFEQIPQGSFTARFNEGTRRLAIGEGVDPSRFVWLSDEISSLLLGNPNRRFRLINAYGDQNFAPMLFMDGHADYQRIIAGVYTTPTYTFRLEP